VVLGRAVLVGIVQLCLLETILQAAVHRLESTAELWSMALWSGTLTATVWAAWPLRRMRHPVLAVAGSALALFAGLEGFDAFYSLRLRPNLGLYTEDDWVSSHPGFQWGWRKTMTSALWHRPVAAPFAPAIEKVLPWDEQQPVTLVDLETGRVSRRASFDLDDSRTLAAARAEKMDLAVLKKNSRVTILGLSLGVGWVPHFVPPEELTPQAVLNFWLLDRQKPREWSEVQVHTNLLGSLVFRTREGSLGLLEFTGPNDQPPGLKIRYRMVPAPVK
jgi:hypothetical protein